MKCAQAQLDTFLLSFNRVLQKPRDMLQVRNQFHKLIRLFCFGAKARPISQFNKVFYVLRK
jgi:hypothetical protein